MSAIDILVGLETPKLIIPSDFKVRNNHYYLSNGDLFFLLQSLQTLKEIGLFLYLRKTNYGQYLWLSCQQFLLLF